MRSPLSLARRDRATVNAGAGPLLYGMTPIRPAPQRAPSPAGLSRPRRSSASRTPPAPHTPKQEEASEFATRALGAVDQ